MTRVNDCLPMFETKVIALILVAAIQAGCSLPEPDGTEAALAARAESLKPLTPSEGRDIKSGSRNALLLSPVVREAASSIRVSADEVRIQRAAIFPSLSLSVGGGIGDAGQGDTTIALTGRQLVADFGQIERQVTAADIELQMNYVTFQQSVDEAMAEMLETYDEVRTHVRVLEVWRQQLSALRELQTLIVRRHEIGAAPISDVLETRKRLQAAEFLVLDTELALAEARERLTQLSGQSRGGEIPVLGSETCASDTSTDALLLAQLNLAKSQIELEIAENARVPSAYIEPIVRNEVGTSNLGFGLNLGINSDLLQGGALSAAVNAARNTLEAAAANVEIIRRDDTIESGRLQREMAAAQQRMGMLDRQISLLAQTRALYRDQYFDLGTREISELLDNEEEYYSRKAELIEVDSEMANSRVTCAILERSLRPAVGVNDTSIYGYPLTETVF